MILMKPTLLCGSALCLVTAFSATHPRAEGDPAPAWNRKAAAAYLDQRATWWTTWPNSQRDHGTFCVSCHTALPYALARPALRQSLGETGPSPAEAALLANITKRVTMWRDVEPFYPDQTARRPQDQRVARHRGDPQRRHPRRAATRAADRSATKGAARSTTCGRCR